MFGLLTGLFSAVGTGLSIFGGLNQAAGERKQAQAHLDEEKSRRKQMTLDFGRQRLEAVRNAIITRSLALAAGSNQGASKSSSVISGASQTTNKASYILEGLNQNQAIGEEVFQARQRYFEAGGQIASGQGLASLGNTVNGLAPQLGQLGTYALGKLGGAQQPVQTSNNSTSSLYSLGPIY